MTFNARSFSSNCPFISAGESAASEQHVDERQSVPARLHPHPDQQESATRDEPAARERRRQFGAAAAGRWRHERDPRLRGGGSGDPERDSELAALESEQQLQIGGVGAGESVVLALVHVVVHIGRAQRWRAKRQGLLEQVRFDARPDQEQRAET